MRAKARKKWFFIAFAERKYLRQKVKGTIKREQKQEKEWFFIAFAERKYLRRSQSTIKREQKQEKKWFFIAFAERERSALPLLPSVATKRT